MLRKHGFTLIELLVVIAIIAVLAAILFPVFARARKAAQASNCQSNLKQIGNAVKMYLSDWQDTYPTNRPVSGTTVGSLAASISLSPTDVTSGTEAPKFVYGVNWVEGLYQYVESVTKSTDPASVWKCQAASNAQLPTTTTTYNAAVNYVFNSCLAEQPEGIIKGAANLMMIREYGNLTVALLRPATSTPTVSTGSSTTVPRYPFLNKTDYYGGTGGTEKVMKLHGNGSHILFADGHVKGFTTEFFPESSTITASKCWDGDTQQWYNFNWTSPSTPDQKAKDQSIAISP